MTRVRCLVAWQQRPRIPWLRQLREVAAMDSTDVTGKIEQALDLLQVAVATLRAGPSTDGFPREKIAKLIERARTRLLTTIDPGNSGFVGNVLACNELLDDALRLAETKTEPSTYQVQAISTIERSQAILYFIAFRNVPGTPKLRSIRPLSTRPKSRLPKSLEIAVATESDAPELEVRSLEPGAIERELQSLGAGATRPKVHSPAPQETEHLLKAEVTFEGPTNFYLGFEEEISSGGLFLSTYNRQVIGTQVALSITLPSGYVALARGSVRWVRDVVDPDEDSTPGIGVRFDGLSLEDRRAIEAFTRIRAPMFYDDE